MRKNLPLLILFAFVAALAFSLLSKPGHIFSSRMLGQQPDSFELPMYRSKEKFSPDLWKGQVVVVNAFASWCAPCAKEAPSLTRLAKMGIVPIYGIAWRDTSEKLGVFLELQGNPYRAVGVDTVGDTTVPLGLTGVPETFVFDKNGKVALHYRSALNDDIIDGDIIPLIQRLEQEHAAP